MNFGKIIVMLMKATDANETADAVIFTIIFSLQKQRKT